MTERSHGGVSASRVPFVAAGATLVVVGFLVGRQLARRGTWVVSASHAAEPPAPLVPVAVEDAGPSSIMTSELERLAGLAVSHGQDDPALDVFLAFVGALDPPPDAATLEPAAQRIGKPRLVEALERQGESRVGARRLLAAVQQAIEDDAREPLRPSSTVTVERPVEAGRRLPELVEALLQAIRVALSLLT